METIRRFLAAERQSFFLLGPRGTGKSTFIKKAFPDALYLDLLLPDVFRSYSARPERFREAVHALKGKTTIIVDEIGSKATKDEMLAAQAQVKEYSKTVQEVYLPCLESEKNESIAALDNMDPEYTQKKATIESVHAKKHNAALDELQAVGDRWNTERKAFSEAQKK